MAKVTITEVDETLSTAEGREARAAAENATEARPAFVVDIGDPMFGTVAFEIRRQADNRFGYEVLHSTDTEAEAREIADRFNAPAEKLDTVIDVENVFDGDNDDEASDVRIVLHPSQADKLAELLRLHVDLDVVEHDNSEPASAQFVRDLLAAIEGRN
jgi:hypothetical protein